MQSFTNSLLHHYVVYQLMTILFHFVMFDFTHCIIAWQLAYGVGTPCINAVFHKGISAGFCLYTVIHRETLLTASLAGCVDYQVTVAQRLAVRILARCGLPSTTCHFYLYTMFRRHSIRCNNKV